MALSKLNNDSFADTAVHGRRNLVINGAMQVAQRGTSDSAAAHNSFIVDRFMFSKAGVDELVVTTSQSTDAPDGFSNSYKIEATTAESALGANDLAYIRTKLEAQNLQHLKYGTSAAEKVTASFWVKASSAGQYTLTLFQDDGSDLVNKTYSVSSANTWEYKTVTFPAHTTVAIANDNGFGLSLNWIILAGTDYTSDSGAQGAWDDTYANAKWANGHTVTSPFMTTNGTFQITGVQLEVGDKATPFEHRSFGEELALCQRYAYMIGDPVNSGQRDVVNNGIALGTTTGYIAIPFPCTMRAEPSLTVNNQGYFRLHSTTGGGKTVTAVTIDGGDTTERMAYINATSSGLTAGQGTLMVTSDASDNGGTLLFSAEF